MSVVFGSMPPSEQEVAQMLSQKLVPHPRLFLNAGEEKLLVKKTESSPFLKSLRDALIANADLILPRPPITRALEGKRLLEVSRTCLGRVTTLSMAWRLTGDQRYQDRAKAELLAAAVFTDWNTQHFLDVAEMTAAVAIGYDWLYPSLDEPTRSTLRKAIIEKGLTPSLPLSSSPWMRGHNNWNQVCNGGLVLGALAVADEKPDLAVQVIARAIDSVPYEMEAYAPDGVYPEGPGYWNYGTTYNVFMIAALESSLGTDFGLMSQQPSFLASADYILHMTGPIGLYNNYSDSGSKTGSLPVLYWMAAHRKDGSLLWLDHPNTHPSCIASYNLPFTLLWADPTLKFSEPKFLDWKGDGVNPVASFRSDWGTNALFLGIKGGSPLVDHAHMDVGSFVLDAEGVRWVHDLGAQSYHSLESRGIDLWNNKQNSQRWEIFRISNLSHNMIMINGALQRVKGKAEITTTGMESVTPVARLDCSTLFVGQAKKVIRTFSMPHRNSVLIEDDIDTVTKNGAIRWQIMTDASIKITDSGVKLEKKGKKLSIHCLKPSSFSWRIVDASKPRHDYDAPNTGMQQLVLDVPVEAGDSPQITVSLTPSSLEKN